VREGGSQGPQERHVPGYGVCQSAGARQAARLGARLSGRSTRVARTCPFVSVPCLLGSGACTTRPVHVHKMIWICKHENAASYNTTGAPAAGEPLRSWCNIFVDNNKGFDILCLQTPYRFTCILSELFTKRSVAFPLAHVDLMCRCVWQLEQVGTAEFSPLPGKSRPNQ
jgi:hypothetical protein